MPGKAGMGPRMHFSTAAGIVFSLVSALVALTHSAVCFVALVHSTVGTRGRMSDPSSWVVKDSSKPSFTSIIFLNSMLDQNKGQSKSTVFHRMSISL